MASSSQNEGRIVPKSRPKTWIWETPIGDAPEHFYYISGTFTKPPGLFVHVNGKGELPPTIVINRAWYDRTELMGYKKNEFGEAAIRPGWKEVVELSRDEATNLADALKQILANEV